MIPPKLLVYRRTHCDVNLENLHETWRRKKSCGELFQNGYRVRQGHHGQEEKGRQTGFYHSVWSCLCILSNWGKTSSVCIWLYWKCMLISFLFFFFVILKCVIVKNILNNKKKKKILFGPYIRLVEYNLR